MGLFDTIVVLDNESDLRCPHGHRLRDFQTKDFDALMATYLLHHGQLHRAIAEDEGKEEDGQDGWRIEGGGAIRERRYSLELVPGPRTLRIYESCDECEPVLIRADQPTYRGDIVNEHRMFVEFDLKLRPGEPVQIVRASGTREDMKKDLLARGLCVLNDDEPLAVAHREIEKANRQIEKAKQSIRHDFRRR